MQPFGHIRAIEIAGEDGLIFYAAGQTLVTYNQVVTAVHQALKHHRPHWLIELVPSYDSLMLVFDMTQVDYHGVYQFVKSVPVSLPPEKNKATLHRLPVWYGAPDANDLTLVSEETGLSADDIIKRHQQTSYNVYAVGFAPGFAYLGELDAALTMPRMANPRKAVPQGAVAIADRQTAVYPDVSPGGWHLLGLCPVPLYNPGSDQPTLLQAGDSVTFYAVSEEEFLAWAQVKEESD